MTLILYTAVGCARCAVIKNLLRAKGLEYAEHDAVGEGREAFAAFYRAHRGQVRRWADGIEFPVLEDGSVVRQGVTAAVAWLEAGARLDGFVVPVRPVKGRVGVEVSGGTPGAVEDLVRVLAFLRGSGLQVDARTVGPNPGVLERLIQAGVVDRVVMEVKGPPERFVDAVDREDAARSMAVAARFPDRRFVTVVAPYLPADAGPGAPAVYPTADEIAAAARWLAEATGSPKQPYVLRPFDPSDCADERLRAIDPLPPDALVRFRSAARRHQVLTEIEKPA
jgi:pyruvate formate lyase activating enzyme